MAVRNQLRDSDWVKKLKHCGAVPLLDLSNCSNGWASPPGDSFQVRGSDYLTTKVKVPGGECSLKPLAFDWIKSSSKIYGVLRHPNSRVRKALQETCNLEGKRAPFIWAFNLQVPSTDNYSLIAYFFSDDPVPKGSLTQRFLEGDDAFRNSRLKLIANVAKGPWIVKTAVGEQAICLLGKAVTCRYLRGDNFMEVDVDIGSSMMANAIVHLALGYVTSLTVDLAFLIEGQVEDELPERILGAIRFSNLDPASASSLDLPVEEDGFSDNGEVSLTFRWWKSFSGLLHVSHEDQIVSLRHRALQKEESGLQ
eukprot:c24177_g1_i1 orf=652-1578(+)